MTKPKRRPDTERFKDKLRDSPALKVTLPKALLEALEHVAGIGGRSGYIRALLEKDPKILAFLHANKKK